MMKKTILLPILSSLLLLLGSCENNFDAHIYGDLIPVSYTHLTLPTNREG